MGKFIAAFNLEHLDRWEADNERMESLETQALEVLQKALSEGDTRVAMFILRNRSEKKPPDGPTTIEEWIENKARFAKEFSGLDELIAGDPEVIKKLRKKWL